MERRSIAAVAAAVLVMFGLSARAVLAQSDAPYAAPVRLPEPIVFLPGSISTGDDESHPTFTPDGQALYFLRNTPDFRHWTVLVSEFADGEWSTPEVAPFSGQHADADVFFTRDAAMLYFVSKRPDQPGAAPGSETDLWVIKRTEEGWGEPKRVDELSSDGNEWFPSMTLSGTMYFGSERRAGNRGPAGTSDLWRSRLIGGRFTRPENLGPTINSPGNDIEAYISPDDSFMIFASDGHADTRGAYDLYVSYHCGGRWSKPVNLGASINSAGWDFSPRISPDGRYLFFTSNRGFADQPFDRPLSDEELTERLHAPGNGLRDIYQVDLSALNLRPGC